MAQTNNLKAEIIRDIIAFFKENILNNQAAEITEHDHLISQGLINSMGIVRLLSHLQQLYAIKDFDKGDLTLDNFQTIGRIADVIAKYR